MRDDSEERPGAAGANAAVAEAKAIARDARRGVEAGERRLKALRAALRAQAAANAEVSGALQRVDARAAEAAQRQRRLRPLIAAAQRRRAQLRADTAAAASSLQQCSAAAAAAVAARATETQPEVPQPTRAELQNSLNAVRAQYQKVCRENRRLSAVLEDLCAEVAPVSRCDEDSEAIGRREAFDEAMRELIRSFETVTRAATR